MLPDLKHRMEGAVNALKTDLNGLRTGRASPDLLAPVQVEAYGSTMPINQVGSVNVAEARSLTVSVWDKGLVAATEKAIRDAGLGLNPSVDGQTIRINLPELNEQRRQELVKLAKKYAEEARIAIRNVRRDGMDSIKKAKDAGQSEDEAKRDMEQVEKLTAELVAQVDGVLAAKEKDILTV